jgi:hypothetical protein
MCLAGKSNPSYNGVLAVRQSRSPVIGERKAILEDAHELVMCFDA